MGTAPTKRARAGVLTMLLELFVAPEFRRHALRQRSAFQVPREPGCLQGYLGVTRRNTICPMWVQLRRSRLSPAEFAAAENAPRGARRWTPLGSDHRRADGLCGLATRVDDGGFDNGRYVDKPRLTVRQETGAHVQLNRVTAVNEGGEASSSETPGRPAACPTKRAACWIRQYPVRPRSAPAERTERSLAGFRMDLDGGVADRQDIAFIGAQRSFALRTARCIPTASPSACACDRGPTGRQYVRTIRPLHGRSQRATCSASPGP